MSENKIATKADLQRMYNKMLPYLGGMPEMVANKFSRGDIYSTDEKMIGQWIDGKPLYQKTHAFNSPTLNSLISLSDILTNADKIMLSETIIERNDDILTPYYNTSTDYAQICMYQTKSNNNKYVIVRSNTGITKMTVTFKYTKTTDSAISIGTDTDYSTTEKIVGTWIDGKPIWQKTIEYGTLPNSINKSVNHNISNIDKIINYNGIAYNSDGLTFHLPNTSSLNINYGIETYVDKNIIYIACNSDRSGYNAIYTIQYTKTTD